MSNMLLSAENLHKTYEKGSQEITVLRGVDFQVDAGQMVAISGRSGAGKSTLLHILGGLEKPDEGEVKWRGISIFQLKDSRRTVLRGNTVGFVFQSHHLLPELTALENVSMPLIVAKQNSRQVRLRAQSCLDMVGLAERGNHKPGELSGGEQQRVAVARALALDPPLVLADEPSGNLDSTTGGTLHQLIYNICRERGTSFIIVTHNEELAALGDSHLHLQEGVLIYSV